MMQFATELMFFDGENQPIDVRKKLKTDFTKDGNLSQFTDLEQILDQAASLLLHYLPQVMKSRLSYAVKNCFCKFTVRCLGDAAESQSAETEDYEEIAKFPVRESVSEDQDAAQDCVVISDVRPSVYPTAADVGVDIHTKETSPAPSLSLSVLGEDETLRQTGQVVHCEDTGASELVVKAADDMENIGNRRTVVSRSTASWENDDKTRSVESPDGTLRKSMPKMQKKAIFKRAKVDRSGDRAPSGDRHVDPLQRLKIATRNVHPVETLIPQLAVELRQSVSVEDQCATGIAEIDINDEMNNNFYFDQPQPPGAPPLIRGRRHLEPVKNRKEAGCMRYAEGHLGQGGYSRVFRAHDHDTGAIVAVKKNKYVEDLSEAVAERDILDQLDHINIIKMLGWQDQNPHFFIFLEWMAGGSVEDLLNQYGPMSDAVIFNYSGQVLDAMAYLLQKEIIHCDIKGANVLVDSTGQVAKLCDFGLAIYLPVPSDNKPRGTQAFMAPDLFDGGHNSPASDVWSFGCMLVQMATGRQPWHECSNTLSLIFKICVQSLAIPPSLCQFLQKLIEDCLLKDGAQRPSVYDLRRRLRDETSTSSLAAERRQVSPNVPSF